MTAVSIFIAAVTILHILGYIGLVYWTTHIKAGGDAKEGEVIDHTWDGDLKEMNNPMPGWWLSLFYLMIAFAIAYLFLYPGVYKGSKGWTQLTQYQQESRRVDARSAEYFRHYAGKSVEDLAKDTDALAIGRRIFLQNCAVCHASDAGGTPGNYPNLTDKDWIWGGTPENIINTITNGHTGAMPAGGALISVTPGQAPSAEDQQKLEDVSNYILALGGYEHDQALAEKGKELYGTSCVACHGPDGKGNPVIIISNFTPVPRENYRIGVSQAGTYHEILNSDDAQYNGSHGKPHSLNLTLPPLATIFLALDTGAEG